MRFKYSQSHFYTKIGGTWNEEHFQNSDSFLGFALDNEHVCSMSGEASNSAKILGDAEMIRGKKTKQCGQNLASRKSTVFFI